MHPYRLAVFLAALLVAMFPASAQVSDRMKATAPEKMMPSEKVQKMRECQERAKQQKIGMADRARFVDECVAAKAK